MILTTDRVRIVRAPTPTITPEELLAECAQAKPATISQALETAEIVLAQNLGDLLDGFRYREELASGRAIRARMVAVALERVRSAKPANDVRAAEAKARAAKQGAMLDQEQERREFVRLHLMLQLNRVSPISASEKLLLSVLQKTAVADATAAEVRLNLLYLAERKLVELRKEAGGWKATDNGMCLLYEFTNPKPGPHYRPGLAQLLAQ